MQDIPHLRLLGTVQIERDGKPVRGFRSRKALALLGYLAVQAHPVPREQLVDLLWCDKPQARGRANLSWVLHRISTLLPGCLRADPHTVGFRRVAPSAGQAACWLDTHAFEEMEAQGDVPSLAAAVDLYRGEFLEGLYLNGCVEFEIWLVAERERWRQRVSRVLGELATHYSRRGEYPEGLHCARRLLALEPWREETHRQVMWLLAYSGQRAAALAQYEACRRVLVEELDVEPAAETISLYQQIRDGELEIPAAPPDRLVDLSIQPPSFLDKEEPVERPVFVAREHQLARLDGFLAQALALGRGALESGTRPGGQVVFVIGDAGEGKTALIQEFARRAQATHPDLIVASGNGNAYTGIGDPYLPFREILGMLAGDVEAPWAAGAITREQARRLWHTLPLMAQALLEAGPDLIDLFVPGAALVRRAAAFIQWPGEADCRQRLEELVERKAALPGDPNLQQSALFEQYTQVLRTLACRRPLLLVLDDLQWADSGSISLLFHLGRRIAGSRILVVGAYRPEEVALGRDGERHPLAPLVNEFKRYFGDIVLDLHQAGGREFLEAYLDTRPNRLDDAFRKTLYRQTSGHPLFTVELLRGMWERGDLVQDREGYWVEGPALDWEILPARVEAVIVERIGQLPARMRETLTVASVEGETFTAEVVAQVQAAGQQNLVECLSGELDRKRHLLTAQGVMRTNNQCLSLYRFRHILFQKYLYNSLDPVERAHLHELVGTALEALYGEGIKEIAVQEPTAPLWLARHFQEAGISQKAVDYLCLAGERAARMSANEEAIAHFTRALQLLKTLPDTPGRARQELTLQLSLGVSLQAIRGYGAPEVGRAYARARELCRHIGETPQLLPALRLLVTFYSSKGEYQTAHEMGEQLLSLAECAEDPLLVAVAHLMLGWNLLFLGKLAQAQAYLERVIAFYDAQQYRSPAFTYGFDHRVACLAFASWSLWALGYPDQALKRSQEALALAQELSHPLSLAFAQFFASIFQAFRRDVQLAQELAEACIRISTEYGFPYWLAAGISLRGWALAEQGQTEAGIAQIRQGIADYQATGAELGRSHQLISLAEAYGKVGQVEEGLTALDEALIIVQRTGEGFCEPEAHRLKGELLWIQGKAEAEVETCFQRAIKVARQQNAKSWELRAMMSLCRLWHSQGSQGKREEARKRLAELYGWFTEGFDTADLKAARTLLAELS
jgi:predicted ATPase/DNA-binding SARP family transcriptional activator